MAPTRTQTVLSERLAKPKTTSTSSIPSKGRAKLSDEALPDSTIPFPKDLASRSRFVLPDGKKVTPHQWKVSTILDRLLLADSNLPLSTFSQVYDHISRIPVGKVTTYGYVAKALDSSPRAVLMNSRSRHTVGGALRWNPFHPHVPCHRIIDSKLFIGGFQGQWGDNKGDENTIGGKEMKKRRLLRAEGVNFDGKGILIGGADKVWTGS
ncbi:BQ2448_6531 [Microbotryum intermedium]|uniref:Methylated-DNA--protein-cysteine methyltransferase n=1 Tax=Microbotryum intermedium TaxID=269621 RepID=A0A238FMS2_9BASI|nr:BQ2448_6531 [Microbotryum intermedium]